MRTLIVNPNTRSSYPGLDDVVAREPPIWAAMIAGKDDHVLDANARAITPIGLAARAASLGPESVLVLANGHNPSASTQTMPAVAEAVKALRGPWHLSVGGLHPSAIPERTARELGVPVTHIAPLATEKPLRWDLLPMQLYRPHNWHRWTGGDGRYAAIYTSLNCPFRCRFCNVHAMFGQPGIRYFPVEWVLREIDVLVKEYEVKHLKIADELFVLDKQRVRAICDGLIERGYDLNIWCYARVNTVQPQLLQKMKRAGVNWVAYGFESASAKVRKGINKRSSEKQTQDAIEWARDAGINICANLIFGLPEDTRQTMKQSLDWACDHNFAQPNFYTAMALPGSELYDETDPDDLPASWAGYAQLGSECRPLPTKHLSSREVLAFRDEAWKFYVTRPEYLDMLRRKFGPEASSEMTRLAQIPLKRKILETPQCESPSDT